jgi:hypothetical protein
MHKISQREILSEGFWNDFTQHPASRKAAKVASWVGSVADTVAPEVMNPVRKGQEWLRNAKEKGQRAGMTKDEITIDYIMEDGFHPLPNQKLQWNPKQNADGTFTATIKVGELINNDQTGKPELGRTFSPDKSTYIVKFNPKDRTAKRVKGPERHLASSHEEIRHALEDAGHDVVGTLTGLHADTRSGTVTGFAMIKISGTPTRKAFTYDTSTKQVTIT